jgi:hypothetical protein
MKTIAKNLTVVAFALVVSHVANAQRVMNDPSYSINNYKHPNKANYMKKKLDAQPVIYLEEIKEESAPKADNSLTSSANYKNMSPSESKTKKFKQTDEPSFHVAPKVSAIHNGNYKSQFPARTRKVEVAKPAQTTEVPVAVN